jgi:hypothetical protein
VLQVATLACVATVSVAGALTACFSRTPEDSSKGELFVLLSLLAVTMFGRMLWDWRAEAGREERDARIEYHVVDAVATVRRTELKVDDAAAVRREGLAAVDDVKQAVVNAGAVNAAVVGELVKVLKNE